MELVPDRYLSLLAAAGWHTERRVALPSQVRARCPQDHPASEILAAFGGLHVGECGPGAECARSDIDFEFFDDGAYSSGYFDDVLEWQSRLGSPLVPVAEIHNGHATLIVAADNRCFGWSLVSNEFWFLGESWSDALDSLLQGLQGKPLIPPTESTITLYGQVITRESPQVYKY